MSIGTGRRIVLEETGDTTPADAAPRARTALEPLAADAEPPIHEAAAPAAVPPSRHRRAVAGGLALGGTLVLLHTLHALGTLVHESPVLGLAWSAVFMLVAGGAGRAAWTLWRRLRLAREQESLRLRARELLAHEGLCEGRALCERLATGAGQSGSPQLRRWREQLHDTHNDREVLQLYARTVLAEADARALAIVSRHAGDVAVMVAVSQFPAVDMLLVLWRQLKLVEDVATAYGVDPGYWGRIRLLRAVLRNMALAGAAEVAAEVGSEVLGAGVLARLSSSAAQGVAAGVLTARLGLRTMDACRAIPWDQDEHPRLRQVTQGVLATAKRYLMADSSAS